MLSGRSSRGGGGVWGACVTMGGQISFLRSSSHKSKNPSTSVAPVGAGRRSLSTRLGGACVGVAMGIAIGLGVVKMGRAFLSGLAVRKPEEEADEGGAEGESSGYGLPYTIEAESELETAAESEAPVTGVTVEVTTPSNSTIDHASWGHVANVIDDRHLSAEVDAAHAARYGRDLWADSEAQQRSSESNGEMEQRYHRHTRAGYTRPSLSAVSWGRLGRLRHPPVGSRGSRREEQDELNRLLDLALDNPFQLFIEFQRRSPIVQRLLRLQDAQQPHAEHLPWQLIVAHQQLEMAIDQMSYEDLWEHFGGAPTPDTAAREVLEKLPCYSVTEKHACVGVGGSGYHSCPICLQLFSIGEEFRSLECGHAFHTGCVDTWLTQHRGDCPVCRKSVCKSV